MVSYCPWNISLWLFLPVLMSIESVLLALETYGLFLVFLFVFIEYLGIPGFPSNIVMPAAGLLVSFHSFTFLSVLFISVLGALASSLLMYAIGRIFGVKALDFSERKFKKMTPLFQKTNRVVENYGDKSVFIARMIPVARTFISVIAGSFKISFIRFVTYSTIGITIWNFVLIFCGYAFAGFFFS